MYGVGDIWTGTAITVMRYSSSRQGGEGTTGGCWLVSRGGLISLSSYQTIQYHTIPKGSKYHQSEAWGNIKKVRLSTKVTPNGDIPQGDYGVTDHTTWSSKLTPRGDHIRWPPFDPGGHWNPHLGNPPNLSPEVTPRGDHVRWPPSWPLRSRLSQFQDIVAKSRLSGRFTYHLQPSKQLSCWQGGVGPAVVGYSWYAPRQRQSK